MANTFKYSQFIRKHIDSISNLLNLGFIQGSNVLIQLILVYIVTRRIGLAEFGHVAVATTYANLIAVVVNYGSNQSGIKDVALYKSETPKLSEVFATIYASRLLIFIASVLVSIILQYSFRITYGWYFLLAGTVILSETLNPFFYFVGIQKLLLYNLMNLAGRLISAAAVIIFIRGKADGPWVNFYLGIGNTLTYGLLFGYLLSKQGIGLSHLNMRSLKTYFSRNFYLTGNSLSVQLQQSFFLFAVSATGNAMVLGAYSICDRIVMAFKLVIISFSTAIYPRAAISFNERKESWMHFKRKINQLLAAGFSAIGICIFLFAPWIARIITGSEDMMAAYYIRCISFVPLIAALNSMNVIELLIKDKYHYIFLIALLLLTATVLTSFAFYFKGNPRLFGYYPLTVELLSLPLYWYYIRRTIIRPGH